MGFQVDQSQLSRKSISIFELSCSQSTYLYFTMLALIYLDFLQPALDCGAMSLTLSAFGIPMFDFHVLIRLKL